MSATYCICCYLSNIGVRFWYLTFTHNVTEINQYKCVDVRYPKYGVIGWYTVSYK